MTIAPDPADIRTARADACVRRELQRGAQVVLADAGGAVLVQPAATTTAESLHFAIRYSSGLIHAAMPSGELDRLRIPDQHVMPGENSGAGFTVAVDAASGIGTGISAADRTHTLQTLAAATSISDDLIRPGHVLPVRCDNLGYTANARLWELTVDLVRESGHRPVAMVCRLMSDDGNTLDAHNAATFAHTHGIALSNRAIR